MLLRNLNKIFNLQQKYVLINATKTKYYTHYKAFETPKVSFSPSRDSSSNSPPRPTRSNEPSQVRWGFVPDEWFVFFQDRTGVSGFYTFCFTVGIYLISKEKLVMEHEYYTGLSTGILWYLGARAIGPGLAANLDKYVDEYQALWEASRVNEKKMYEEQIFDEEEMQFNVEGQLILIDAKRENIALQLEEEYRTRLMHVYEHVKRQLDFTILYRRRQMTYVRDNMVEWVQKGVMALLTPDFLDKHLNYCIDEFEKSLKTLA